VTTEAKFILLMVIVSAATIIAVIAARLGWRPW
jgi:hypothetical protein